MAALIRDRLSWGIISFIWVLLWAGGGWAEESLGKSDRPKISEERNQTSSEVPESRPQEAGGTEAKEPSAGAAPQPPPIPQETGTRKVLVSAGIGVRNTHWEHMEDPGNTNASYDVKDAQYTIISGDLTIPHVATKLGFNMANDSGGVSDLKQIGGYVGVSNFSIVAEKGKLGGRAYFSGSISSEQSRDIEFDQEYLYTEVDYSPDSEEFPFYFGLRYTKWKLPGEIALLGPGASSGPTIFDADFESAFYSIIFGMDLLKRDLLQKPDEWPSGFGVMFTFLTGLGWGSSKIGHKAVRAVSSIFGKEVTEKEPGVMTVHLATQVGPKYGFTIGGLKGILGIGYDWNILMLLQMARNAESSTEVMPVAYPNFIYRGLIFRAHMVF